MIKHILLLLLCINLFAAKVLDSTYYIDSNEIYINTIVKDTNQSIVLFKIPNGRYHKKVDAKEILKILKIYGYSNYTYKSRYINFIKKSPIDTSKISQKLQEYYKQHYEDIDIHSISVNPRGYLKKMPDKYTIDIRSKNYLSRIGIVSIKTPKRKKIFFNYIIDADVGIYISRKKIQKKEKLTQLNTQKKVVTLDRFKAKPIQNIQDKNLQAKHHIQTRRLITTRDVEPLSVVKRGTYISVGLKANNMNITTTAKALEDGRVGQIIRVMQPNGKKLRVKILNKNMAEIQ